MTFQERCPPSYSEVNQENTSCSTCGSRIHYTMFDGLIRCSWCNGIIDDSTEIEE